jgi:hypothetical protein
MRRMSTPVSVFCTCLTLGVWSQARPQRASKVIPFDVPGAGTSPRILSAVWKQFKLFILNEQQLLCCFSA